MVVSSRAATTAPPPATTGTATAAVLRRNPAGRSRPESSGDGESRRRPGPHDRERTVLVEAAVDDRLDGLAQRTRAAPYHRGRVCRQGPRSTTSTRVRVGPLLDVGDGQVSSTPRRTVEWGAEDGRRGSVGRALQVRIVPDAVPRCVTSTRRDTLSSVVPGSPTASSAVRRCAVERQVRRTRDSRASGRCPSRNVEGWRRACCDRRPSAELLTMHLRLRGLRRRRRRAGRARRGVAVPRLGRHPMTKELPAPRPGFATGER